MRDYRIRFRHLRSFLIIAQLKSIGRAAQALTVTQPALSKTLGELERALQARLFDRSKHGVELTRFGKMFLQRAAASLASLEQGVDEVRAAQGTEAADLSFGAMPNVAPRIVPLAVKLFRETHARTGVRVVGGSNAQLMDLLRVGEIDFVVGRLSRPETMLELSFEQLYTESLTVVARVGHELAARRRVKPSMLAGYPWVVPEGETIIGYEVNRYLLRHGVEPRAGRYESISLDFGRGFVRNTDALWFVPKGVIEVDLEDGTLAELAINQKELEGPVGITTRHQKATRPIASEMMNAIRQVCITVGRSGGPGIVETQRPTRQRAKRQSRSGLRKGKK